MYKVQSAVLKVKNLFVCCLSLLTKDPTRCWRRCTQVIKKLSGALMKEPASKVMTVTNEGFYFGVAE